MWYQFSRVNSLRLLRGAVRFSLSASSNIRYTTNVAYYSTIGFDKRNKQTNNNNIFLSDKIHQSYVLDPSECNTWSKEQVCSLLCSEVHEGGAGLSLEEVKPLYDNEFNGRSISNIVYDIMNQRDAVDDCLQSFPHVPSERMKVVVFWVENLLKTQKLGLGLLTSDQLKELICGSVLSKKEFRPFRKMSGSEFHSQVVKPIIKGKYSEIMVKDQVISVPVKLRLWIESNHFKVIPQYNLLPSWNTENTVFQGIKSLQEKISRLVKLNVIIASNQSELTFIIEKLVPFIDEFEQCLKGYEERKASSIADFNIQMRKLGLVRENSQIYLFPNNAEEKSMSCKYIACSFAPTFPEDKYKERNQTLY